MHRVTVKKTQNAKTTKKSSAHSTIRRLSRASPHKNHSKSFHTSKTHHKLIKVSPTSKTSSSHRGFASSVSYLSVGEPAKRIPATNNAFNRQEFDELLLRKMFVVPSFELYGGVAGLYDYGPNGCSIMANIQREWRQHFIQQESMMEVSCTVLTPEPVLAASGHLSRFTDWMVITSETNEYLRADKVVENFLDEMITQLESIPSEKLTSEHRQKLAQAVHHRTLAGGMNGEQLEGLIAQYNIKVQGETLSSPKPFNLMFPTSIGPTGKYPAYLRPETAQGIFLNFKRLYDQNNRRLPMSVAQIGSAYRNEISPRGGLLRTREFTMAEIEHFVHPERKSDARFHKVRGISSVFLSAAEQQTEQQVEDVIATAATAAAASALTTQGRQMTFGDAVDHGFVANEALGFFLAKTFLFLTKIGIDPARIRFRQHLADEMAHYACDCWDAEILTSAGWIECVGHADRSAHDLKVHSLATNNDLVATEPLDEPIPVVQIQAKPQKGAIAKAFAKSPYRAQVMPYVSALTETDALRIVESIQQTQRQNGIPELNFEHEATKPQAQPDIIIASLTPMDFPLHIPGVDEPVIFNTSMFSIQQATILQSVETFHPHVIEPSFGLGRIFSSLLEHVYDVRENDAQRKVLRLPARMAPQQLGLFTVVNNIDFGDVLHQLQDKAIMKHNLNIQIDTSRASIGKKYARWDETGLPYVISIDSETLPSSTNDNNNNNNVDGNDTEATATSEAATTTTVSKLPTVTIRDRDTTAQVKVPLEHAVDIVADLVYQRKTWSNVVADFAPISNGNETTTL